MLVTKKSKRKPTGGLRSTSRRKDKKLSELANAPTNTTVAKDKEKRKLYRGKGGNVKTKAIEVKKINLVLEDGKIVSADVVSVTKNTANKEYTRRNIITKGAEIKVKYNDKEYIAKVTSRPGQSGIVSAKTLKK
jgi:small subunit ribosomal protein S8e